MERILTSKEMKTADANTINLHKISAACLMERAALSCADKIIEVAPLDSDICVICGSGNNGGDGFAIGRILHTKGFKVVIVFLGDQDKMSPDTKLQFEIVSSYGIKVTNELNFIRNSDILVDAIFGIGLNRPVEGLYLEAIEAFNEADALFKFAVDIPSGIDADTGHLLGQACKCHRTITFNYKKVGHLLYPGREYSGFVDVCDIGITEHSLENVQEKYLSFELEDLSLIPNRKADSHKGTYGKVFIIAGNDSYAGACYLSAAAALRSGCGMVRIYTHINNKNFILDKLPEAIIDTYSSKIDFNVISQGLEWCDAVVIGPGLGLNDNSRNMTKFILENSQVPAIIDADALNCISEDINLLLRPHFDLILTPHLGEMSRLKNESVNYISDNMISIAEDFAMDNQVILVLKSASTVTALPYDRTYINQSGNSGMSTAGSGDVLTGIIASLIAQGMKSSQATSLGVYLHGLCGDIAASKFTEFSMTASDIIDSLVDVFSKDFFGDIDER